MHLLDQLPLTFETQNMPWRSRWGCSLPNTSQTKNTIQNLQHAGYFGKRKKKNKPLLKCYIGHQGKLFSTVSRIEDPVGTCLKAQFKFQANPFVGGDLS